MSQPQVPVGVKRDRAVGMFGSVGAILLQHGSVSAVGGLELLMRHFDEGAFHFPDAFFGEPPVAFHQSA